MAKANTSITTENRSGSAADAAAKEQRTEMPLSDLHPFEGHPFKVLDDELMEQTVESIKQIGVVSPLIVRPDPEDGFETFRTPQTSCGTAGRFGDRAGHHQGNGR